MFRCHFFIYISILYSGALKKKRSEISNFTSLGFSECLVGVKLCLNSTYSVYDNVYYSHVFGTVMGFPISCCQFSYRRTWKEDYYLFGLCASFLQMICRQVGIFYVYMLMNAFNLFHQHSQFTVEKPQNCSIKFLDI